jgi:hypothetical protein
MCTVGSGPTRRFSFRFLVPPLGQVDVVSQAVLIVSGLHDESRALSFFRRVCGIKVDYIPIPITETGGTDINRGGSFLIGLSTAKHGLSEFSPWRKYISRRHQS